MKYLLALILLVPFAAGSEEYLVRLSNPDELAELCPILYAKRGRPPGWNEARCVSIFARIGVETFGDLVDGEALRAEVRRLKQVDRQKRARVTLAAPTATPSAAPTATPSPTP